MDAYLEQEKNTLIEKKIKMAAFDNQSSKAIV